jgi:thiosulfate/3-mercaptopyruvate sulfurtransferase
LRGAAMCLAKVAPIVSVSWLATRLTSVRVVDASWYLPSMDRSGREEFLVRRIPTAQFFDVDLQTDDTSGLPHMLPSAPYFSKEMSAMGISSIDHVVCYDGAGVFSAPRLWWMLRAFGHDKASVLDGGLPAWVAAGEPVETGTPTPAPPASGSFNAVLRPELVLDLEAVKASWPADTPGAPPVSAGGDQLCMVDARAAARFKGKAPEPRPGLRSGHIPGSLNVPFTEVLQGGFGGPLLPPEALKKVFQSAGVPVHGQCRLGVSCGSGMTAAIVALALAQSGRADVPLYDGSAAEYLDPKLNNPVAP